MKPAFVALKQAGIMYCDHFRRQEAMHFFIHLTNTLSHPRRWVCLSGHYECSGVERGVCFHRYERCRPIAGYLGRSGNPNHWTDPEHFIFFLCFISLFQASLCVERKCLSSSFFFPPDVRIKKSLCKVHGYLRDACQKMTQSHCHLIAPDWLQFFAFLFTQGALPSLHLTFLVGDQRYEAGALTTTSTRDQNIWHVKVKGQWLRGENELLNKPDTIQLVFIWPPVKNLDILVHCYELFLHRAGECGLTLFDLVECYLGLQTYFILSSMTFHQQLTQHE